MSSLRRTLAAQGVYYVATGAAPFVSRRAFEAVTGPKREWWLVQTVGGLVTAIGGGARSKYWLKAIATILAIPVDIPADGDFGAAFGAARLGLIAATQADPLAVCTPPVTSETIEPDKALTAAYSDAYARYRALYPAIKGATT